jgi:TetR/AcrR family transcriptional regulator, regulator of cefoperazone and chloramphenicol sensitivity
MRMVEGLLRRPAAGEDRRPSLVRAAFACIAADGFEGLRTRSVAKRAGVNIATLHYYFPTKEALIAGVAEYIASQFINLHAKPVPPTGSTALDRLRQEFADARYYYAKHPELAAVLFELQLRGRRDAAIRKIIAPLTRHWRAGIEQWMQVGVAEGLFRRDVNPAAAATLLVSALSGAAFLELSAPKLEQIFEELGRWLLVSATQRKSVQRKSVQGKKRKP